ncbi:exo-beta-N-acetylmuramidase NamZ family protein [Polaribacter uvawellassae]|uniref:exo-beta-N-acetylmuramidase NamZ family protein n=1 Tax=Polaribacter uvawellassae TaxID=3133495 RepID=UPI00321A6A11
MIPLVRFKSTYLILFLGICFPLTSCAQESTEIKVAAEQTELYLNLLKGKNIAVVANQTSVIGKKEKRKEKREFVHLVDSLLSLNINIKKVFAPEHGFRGKADAGELIKDGFDTKTGLPILSLHGKSKKPSAEQLKGIDVIIFDIQDVGARFYTYISSLHYVMEAAAESGIPVIVLDRPNPNGHYVDGPILEMKHSSFVGKHPVPVVYGMTIGEYGQMINGEKWLKNGIQCDLTVIPLKNYTHNSEYSLTIRPSPNLPNDKSINLYPSLGFFEGTIINAGRGTEFQFQRYGASFFPKSTFSYTPKPNFGSKYPKQEGKLCYGVDLSNTKKLSSLNLEWLIDAYQKTPKTEKFFGKTFTIHAGNTKLQQQIEQGVTAKEIRKTWQKGLSDFKKIRSNYLIYN